MATKLALVSGKPYVLNVESSVLNCEPFGFNNIGDDFTLFSLVDGRPLAAGVYSDFVDSNDAVFSKEDLTQFLFDNAGFNTAGGGSSATYQRGTFDFVSTGDSATIDIPNNLPDAATWVNLYFSDPKYGDINTAEVSLWGPAEETPGYIRISGETDFPLGSVAIYWEVAII